jgi:cell division septal protein FtsQ
MSPEIDPKNQKKRSRSSTSVFSGLSRYLPDQFYWWQILYVCVALLALLVIYDFFNFIHNNSQYRAEVVIKGLEKLETDQVTNKLSTNIGSDKPGLVSLSVGAIQDTLRSEFSRFKSVNVRKDFPDKLVITVEEHKPVALVARVDQGSKRYYLPASESGVVFQPTEDEVDELPETVPVVRGLETAVPGSQDYQQKWKRVQQVLEAAREQFELSRLNWVKVRTGGYVEVEINRPKTLKVRLGVDNYSDKMAKLQKMMQTEQFMNINRYVNLSDLDNVRVL